MNAQAIGSSGAHPSFFALDRFSLGGPVVDADVAAHVAGCARCDAHLKLLAQTVEIPRWVGALEAERPARSIARLRMRQALGGALAIAAAAALFIAIKPAQTPEQGVKGAPSIAVYVKRGARVALWDGRASLQAGDDLRLKVSGAGFTHLAIAHLDGGAGTLTELFSGDVSESGETLVPASWSLDGEPGPERILIVFSKAPLAAQELRAAAEQHPRTEQLWSTLLELNKQGEKR